METLPLELHEHIFSYLLPCGDRSADCAVPLSTQAERIDVYNLRLTSRDIKTGTIQAFAKIVEDVPTKCTEDGLQSLAQLITLPPISKRITSLALDTSKMFIGEAHEEQTLDYVRLMCSVRNKWLQSGFQQELVTILCGLPRLEHFTCVTKLTSGVAVEKFGWRRMVALRRVARTATDPLLYIQKALEESKISLKLKTFLLLTSVSESLTEEGTSPAPREPLHLLQLQHLTFSPICHDISSFRVKACTLTSIHIILSPREFHLNIGAHEFAPTLRSITLSANNTTIAQEILWTNLQAVASSNMPALESLRISNMVVSIDIGHDPPENLTTPPHFQQVTLDSVQMCFTDEITLSGPSEPREIGTEWKALRVLRERADRVIVRFQSKERILEDLDET